MLKQKKEWSIWVDRGGTFTDIIARSRNGQLHAHKLLSQRSDGSDPVFCGIKELLSSLGSDLSQISSLRIGTTVGTNALLERRGARLALVCSKGFKDAVRIAYQNRPKIFALEIQLPDMIYERVLEFDERLDFQGQQIRKPDLEALKNDLQAVYDSGIRSLAIALMHSVRNPKHELLAAKLARDIGFEQISLSHECAQLMKYVSRADTCLVDAYLTPLLKNYIRDLSCRLDESGSCLDQISFMQSHGALISAELFAGKDSVLSGPAGGLVGAIKAAADCSFKKLISFDMGGTSTDVSYIDGEIEHIYDTEIAGLRIRAPVCDIHTVAAGGGSILSFNGGRYRVGPESAGAIPGPLSYRQKGPLTLTDANLMLGRIQIDSFPKIFGKEKNEGLDLPAVQEAFAALATEIAAESGKYKSPELTAFGFLKIAVNKMANAIKHVSIQRGHEIRDTVLVCFGGAGGQLACLIAEELALSKILIHPLAGLLSAYGIGLAETAVQKELELDLKLRETSKEILDREIASLQADARDSLSYKDPQQELVFKMKALIKLEGSDYELAVDYDEIEQMKLAFNEKHLSRYGFIDENRDHVLSSLSLQAAVLQNDKPDFVPPASATNTELEAAQSPEEKGKSIEPAGCQRSTKQRSQCSLFAGANENSARWQSCLKIERSSLGTDELIQGPAIITEPHTTTVVEPGWTLSLLKNGSLLIAKTESKSPAPESTTAESGANGRQPSDSSIQPVNLTIKPGNPPIETVAGRTDPDPMSLELFNNLFSFVAEQMGLTLQNTSKSVNIRERLDFSCAIFDSGGNLLANAPHIPVHLGSMADAVKNLIELKGNGMQTADAYATNDPYKGGTHLPDITVISPAFDQDGQLRFFVASRGHHADVGGISPGSMPANSSHIDEEGILFQQLLIMRGGKVQEQEILQLLGSGKYPARNPNQNLADLKAQIAANNSGIRQLEALIAKWGEKTVLDYMQHVQNNAEYCVKKAISKLHSGEFSCIMDDGNQIKVRIDIDKRNSEAIIDFTGTSSQSSSNFNAPLAVCKAAVLYVFRTLVSDEIPLNAGCFRPLKLIVPEGCLLNPRYPAPVVAGNVESSQVIVDTLYAALRVMAASQGTMNNLSFGNEKLQYYETICGGSGAGKDFEGAGPVQTHMTNSRLTDPELLESRFPVRLLEFSIRENSGGRGKRRGGNGACRKILFLEKMSASLLSNRRITEPHGLEGGGAGAKGKNYIAKAGGKLLALPYRAGFELDAGDVLVIETPGGGAFGFEMEDND